MASAFSTAKNVELLWLYLLQNHHTNPTKENCPHTTDISAAIDSDKQYVVHKNSKHNNLFHV